MIKKLSLACLFTFLTFLNVTAQSGINTKDPKATLDIRADASNRNVAPGLIAPRVTLTYLLENTNLYTSEQKGTILYVYDVVEATTETQGPSTNSIDVDGYYYFDGNFWVLFVVPDEITLPTEPWRVDIDGAEATLNNQNIVQNAQVGVGFSQEINSSAQFEVRSSDKGILIPRMTTLERDAIVNPANSLFIFNLDTSCFEFYKRDRWKSICGDLGEAEISVPNCNSARFFGLYKVGKIVEIGNNYFQITLNVVEAGNYSILVSNSTAGFFSQNDGTFPNTGNYTIQIPVIGTPVIAGIQTFEIKINDEVIQCSVDVDVQPADVQFNNIVFVSADLLKRGESSNGKTMVITVDVQSGGAFNFQTNTVNGVIYSAENIELSVGNNQTVTLYANGNPPTAAGTFQYSISGSGYTGNTVQGTVEVEESLAQITQINCGSAVVNSTYKLETALTASNYIDIPVTSTSTGVYNISISSSENPGFSFTGSGTITGTGTSNIRVYGTGTPTKAGRLPFTVTVNGASCTLYIDVVLPPKSILLVGNSFGQVNLALANAQNFGPNGKTKIESINRINAGSSISAANLRSRINNDGVQVIIVGWSWNPNAEIVGILKDFIQNKKGFVFWIESQDDQTYIKNLIDQTFNTNVTMTDDEYSIFTAKLDSNIPTDNPYINGPFGNISDKIVRADDYASWLGIVPSTLPSTLKGLLNLPANGTTSTTGNNSARTTFIYGDGFFMFPDWGMSNYSSSYYGFGNPISTGTGTFNGYQGWDGTSVGIKSINNTNVVNWLLFGNAMDHIFNYVQQNYIQSYQVQ